ncbi:MAG: M20/M25/M40 family metallo-hydrolase [Chitinivibrionales bacterium]|nr:M20/M25/M40 family metallo-hydrolase [Chitinivibrionales bacterium]
MKMFERIAIKNDTNRMAASQGHEQTALYVATKLWIAGYKVQIQKFDFPFFQETEEPTFEQITPNPLQYKSNSPDGMYTITYSPSDSITGIIQPVDVMIPPGDTANSSTSGCEESDFESFTEGNIALIQRGSLTFRGKALHAQNAGASAVIIFNEGQNGRTEAIQGTLSDTGIKIPVIFTSYEIGEQLYTLSRTQEVKVRIRVSTICQTRKTFNVIAETRAGDTDQIAMIGSHLDGVTAGPGINDNGSGCAAILEAALKLAEIKSAYPFKNKIRFAFWSGEELGLHGSTYYVEHLTPQQRQQIRWYLNFDMIASPNYVRFIYDGDGSNFKIPAPQGSDLIEELFKNYFEIVNLPTEETPINGDSDYQPFLNASIPIGGLFTGAAGIKTDSQFIAFGGIPGEPYDPNYHTRKDDLKNCNFEVLGQMLGAITYAVIVCAYDDLPQPLELRQGAYEYVQKPMMEYKGSYFQK